MTDIPRHLVDIALRAGLIDTDALRVVDLPAADADVHAFVADLKQRKPHFFHVKSAKDMSPAERAAAIAEAKANPRPAPRVTAPLAQPRTAEPAPAAPKVPPKSAMVMLIEERAAYLREHAKKYPTEMAGFSYPRKSPFAN